MCSVAVIEDLGRKTGQTCSFSGPELERRHCRTVLAEVNDKVLALGDGHRLSRLVLPVNDNLAILSFG